MTGTLITYCLLAVAFLLTVPAASHTGLETWGSLAASSTAFVAMAINQFLAARPKIFEGAFGGLDRMYRTHKTMGKIALVLILVHYFVTPNFKGQILTTGLNNFAKDAANIGFWTLLILIAVSLFKQIPFTKIKIPYHIWRQSHRFIGVAFLFIAFHQMFIKRPFDGNVLLAGYLNIFAILGIASFIYTQLAPFLRRKKYEITSVAHQGGATHISAKPVSKPLKSAPGQFAVIKLKKKGLGEPHPFSISGRDKDGALNFSIKASGDFTKRLHEQAEVGDKMLVEGGYGRFKFSPKHPRQLWLAGGIGITPLLAMAQNLDSSLEQEVCLVHCVRSEDEAVQQEMLLRKAAEVKNFAYAFYTSENNGHMNAEKLKDLVGFELDGALMMFCGPPPLRSAIEKGLKAMGKTFSSTKFELFEFR
ncbi:MAG: ferric reductase-like transmembrane domain-containing protein [Rhizobiaceae bacterium]